MKTPATANAINAQCPGCDTSKRLQYDVKTDEMTCWKCGLVSTINEARAHYLEKKVKK